MPIISNVTARSLKGRIAQGTIIALLTVGGLTILYPFVVMISGSFRSELDQSDFSLVPGYWYDDDVLYAKFLETKYNQRVSDLNAAHRSRYFSFRAAKPPESLDELLVDRFRAFVRSDLVLPHWQSLGGIAGVRTTPEHLRALRHRLHEVYKGDIVALGRDAGSPVRRWSALIAPPPEWGRRRYDFNPGPIHDAYTALYDEYDVAHRQLVSITGLFLESMIYPVYGQVSVDAYNEAHTRHVESFSDFRLPRTAPGPDQPTLRAEWTEFVRAELHPSFIVIRENLRPELEVTYRRVLEEQYGSIQALNEAWDESFNSFADVQLAAGEWLRGAERADYELFLAELPIEAIELTGPEYAWADTLVAEGLAPDVEHAPAMPVAQMEWAFVQRESMGLRWLYTVRNYVNVFDELIFQGRALMNTVVFVLLSLVGALLLNPLAAYALSRWQLPGTYKVLLLLLATTAFPPMVTLIPQFIMLRNLNLLNTFVALVLPMLVNGYMVFLLKGFFDSLPREIYEAARIDGASEMRMFFQFTLALSKPILAVLALGTFSAAYTAFLYPLLIAPDEEMWLISVWLYQFQQRSNTPAVFASVVVASIPTLVLFLLAQRTIMRGIAVPSEK